MTPRQVLNWDAGRGSSSQRRARRRWLKSPESGFGGNGRTVPCFHCGRRVRKMEVDRYPVCGHDGGTYRRTNIVPSCPRCNRGRCARCSSEVVNGVIHRGQKWKIIVKAQK